MKIKFISNVTVAITIVFSMNILGQEMDRTALPIKEPIRQTYKQLDARNATPQARFNVKEWLSAKEDDLTNVGVDGGTHVADYGTSSKFNGKIEYVTVERK